MSAIWTLHLAATLFMTGVIWFVQLVHYPLFARVGGTVAVGTCAGESRAAESDFAAYEVEHSRRTSWVVVLPMLVELATGVYLAFTGSIGTPLQGTIQGAVTADLIGSSSEALLPQNLHSPVLSWVALGLLVAIWASTFLLQVPAHSVLARGFDTSAHRRLVTTNWIRTVLWSVRSALLVWILLRAA